MTLPCSLISTLGAIALISGTLATDLTAQCEPQWQEVGGIDGTSGDVLASTMWDPDGPGPEVARLVVAGRFGSAGGRAIQHIATYDPATGEWSPLGQAPGAITALAANANGDLYATTDSVSGPVLFADELVRWDGTSWVSIGQPTIGGIAAVTALPNGDVVVGGSFSDINGVAANRVARWDGANWNPMGVGFDGISPQFSTVSSLVTLANGDVVAGGNITVASGGNPSDYIARWDGTNWQPLGAGIGDLPHDMVTMPNGDLVVAGRFGNPPFGLAIWDGANWSYDGALITGTVDTVTAVGNDLVVGGQFRSIDGVTVQNVAQRNGSTWSAMGAGITSQFYLYINTLTAMPNGDVFAGGNFDTADGQPANRCATWDGSAWVTTTNGISTSDVNVVTNLANGDLIAGGSFTTAVLTPANRVARWNGTEWLALGSGVDDDVNAVLAMPNGDLIVGGLFTTAGGLSANRVARWDGTAWSAMGSGMNDEVTSLALTPNGTIVAGGNFTTADGVTVNRIASWNGSSWQALGNGVNAKVFAVTTLANGDIVAGGQFTNASGTPASGIGRWDGTSWHALGSGLNNLAESLHVRPNGDLIAGGFFTTAGGIAAQGIARWDGSTWHAMASSVVGFFGTNGTVKSMTTAPGGDLIVAGTFFAIDGVDTTNIARWDGGIWTALAEPLGGLTGASTITGVCTTPEGRIIAASNLPSFDNIPSQGLAILASPCPATSDSITNGCVGSNGLNELTTQRLPWVGDTFSSIATGMPINSLAIEVLGFAPISTPLASLLPQGVAGCDLLTTLDGLALFLTTTGTVQTGFAIPDDPTLVGGMLYQQVVPLELDAGGNITAITSTNRLDLVIGAF